MIFDPAALALDALFVNPCMFDSRDAWRRTGFMVIDPAKPSECMVASHPSAPGYLFKKYGNDVPQKEQSKNFEDRIEGAARLARFIAKERLQHVVVPKKHLHDLPRKFGKSSQLIVVERLDVLGPDESVLRYRDIAEDVLRDLLAVIAKFEGLDSNAKNIPFTTDGKIAFVDLENWERSKKRRLKSIGGYLPPDRLRFARKILKKLE